MSYETQIKFDFERAERAANKDREVYLKAYAEAAVGLSKLNPRGFQGMSDAEKTLAGAVEAEVHEAEAAWERTAGAARKAREQLVKARAQRDAWLANGHRHPDTGRFTAIFPPAHRVAMGDDGRPTGHFLPRENT